MFLIYSILYAAVLLILIVPQYLKRPAGLRRKWLLDKFGFFEASPDAQRPAPVWVHAVSVGEVHAAIPLLKKLHSSYPGLAIILSTITDTGRKVAIEKSPEGTSVVYLPFDMKFILNRCFRKMSPRVLVIMETELWPNLLRVASERNIPVILLNGRISEKSSAGYRKISFFMKKVFACVSVFGMQSALDAGRLQSVGADEQKIRVTGNFKFDISMPDRKPAWAEAVRGPVIVAGSTHRGEEEMILEAYRENISRFPVLNLIIAPRHPERFGEAEEIIRRSGVPCIRRSDVAADLRELQAMEHGVILLDTIGELSSVFGVADVAIIGKSFNGIGGQNPLEPAFWGKPFICGPHMENFPFIREFYEEGAAFEVESTGLAKKIKELLIQPEKAQAAGEKAREIILRNSGAVGRAMDLITNYMGPRS